MRQQVICDRFNPRSNTRNEVVVVTAPEAYLEPCQTSVSFFAKIVNGLKSLIIFAKILHRRYLTGI